jgi:RNA polymerase sigma-70 factor (ECF subfamily)
MPQGAKTTGMADAANKRPSALVAAYLEKRPNLLRFFTMRTSSASEAEDIVQEIYVRIATVDDAAIENPLAYLYRLGTNVMLDRVRARRRSAARDDAYFQTFQAGTSAEAASDAPSPESAWEARMRLEHVLAVVERMPPRRKQVFIMHKIDALSYAEIAQSLRISRSAVEKLMMAALRDLSAGDA